MIPQTEFVNLYKSIITFIIMTAVCIRVYKIG